MFIIWTFQKEVALLGSENLNLQREIEQFAIEMLNSKLALNNQLEMVRLCDFFLWIFFLSLFCLFGQIHFLIIYRFFLFSILRPSVYM